MAETLAVSLADPDVRVVDTDTGTWFVSGLNVRELVARVRDADDIAEVKSTVPPVAEDAALVNVADDTGRRVHAYRSVAGGYRLYYLRKPNGTAMITDHLRNALAALPVEARTVSDTAVADHLLFRAPVGADGIVEPVSGVAQGDWLTWDLTADERRIERVDSLDGTEHVEPAAAPDAIESAYESILGLDGVVDDPVNCYSGGVDSTLTQTLLGADAPMLNVGIDSPEYAFEMEYARDGASYFDAPFEQTVLDESRVLTHLEDAIEATGSPSCPFQTVLMNTALSSDEGRQYLMAVGADSIFGNTGTKGARVADWAAPMVGTPPAKVASRLAPDTVGDYIDWLGTLDEQLDRSVADPQSYAQQYSTYTNPALVGTLFDDELVAERCRAQSAYVRDRAPIDGSAGRFGRQAEWRHHCLVFGHRVGSRWRQMALAHGNTLVNPFETRRLIECALSVPADRRFVQGPTAGRDLSTKYLLKRLLDRRLPEYPTDREKGAGVLPFERYLADGPLAGVFDRYPLPSFVPSGDRSTVVESGRQAWNVLTYAVWRDRVQQNAALDPVPSTQRYEWTTPEAAISG
ncbi:hypothetical protein BV210_17825 (plasmid) [Halorientalis sp. IM1011]|uniref:asparagine synthase-related protein n=1 Tax=Halorientalis sp. IM1011 TaxID=1932360 RepID=UPI00097CCFDA|nr:asparagine synthase-related protein [Halorientalis sp. IM1011]AQL44629.1 hypothetical protein BV210_17825 [Halorientalis sp. IM1011]